jgi:hypothetical protein
VWRPIKPPGDGARAAGAGGASRLTPQAIEPFLLKARIGATRGAGGGVTDSLRATLSDGTLTYDAQIQTVDVSKARFEAGKASEVNFRDSYRYNVAAYRLSRLLGMDNAPVSVERRVDGKPAASPGGSTMWR